MVIYGDYHTHTKYSKKHHGKGTILDNASFAVSKGLKEIAISDHGFNHLVFGVKRKEMPQIREEIFTAKEVAGINILCSIEANLISLDGDIDLNEEDYENFDIVLMGFHKLVKYKTIKDFFKFGLPNILSKYIKPTKKQINRNTTAYLKAIDKYPIDVITHLGHDCPVDVMAVAKLAKQKGILIELNGKRINFTDQEIVAMAKEGVKFIINSDAHSPDRVGEVNNGINRIFRLGVSPSQVVNLDKLPKFNNKKRD